MTSDYRRHRYQRMERKGATVGEWIEEKRREQYNCCAICARPFSDSRPPRPDHDHRCCRSGCWNCYRGVLCTGCNTALGIFRDDIRTLAAAIVYLQEHPVIVEETLEAAQTDRH